MRFLWSIATVLSVSSHFAAAVFRDDAGVVDWHHVLIGHPRRDATFFHQPHLDSKASLIYTISERNIVAAVNPRDGSVVWRQQVPGGPTTGFASLRAGQDSDNVVSGAGSEVVAWGAPDGREIWRRDLGAGQLRDLELLGIGSGKEDTLVKDTLALVGSTTSRVVRLNGVDGSTVWEYIDDSGDIPHQISTSATHVFYVSLHSTLLGGGYKIKVTTLDPINGKRIEQHTLSDGEVTDASHILAVGANSASPVIVWTDRSYSTLKVNVIGTSSTSSFKIASPTGDHVEQVSVLAPSRHNSRPHLLVQYHSSQQSWAEVYHVNLQKSTVTKAYDLPKIKGRSAFTATSDGSNVYFTRVTQYEVSVVSSASHGVLVKWPLKGLHANTDLEDVQPIHAVTELSVKGETVSAARSAVLLSSGNWILLRDNSVAWSRSEELANTITAAFAYPPLPVSHERILELQSTSALQSYISRWTRHMHDLQALPAFLPTIPKRILTSLGMVERTDSDVSRTLRSFGFHKLIVCVTTSGHVLGLDAGGSGRLLWSRQLPAELLPLPSSIPLLYAYSDATMEYKQSEGAAEKFIFNATTGASIDHDDQTKTTVKYLSLDRDGAGIGVEGSGVSKNDARWRFQPVKDETILSMVTRPLDDPVASIGRVMGDRSVLYKYLNPNLLLVATTPALGQSITITLVDSISGETLYTGTHSDTVLAQPFAAIVSENWFAYTFTQSSAGEGTTAVQLVAGELYESAITDDRGPLTNGSESFVSHKPHVVSQNWIVSEPISQLTVTQTNQGITSKELLAVLPSTNSIVGIPRAIIDPRRTIGRDPSKTEQMEGLIRYTPTLEFDPKWYLNHQREIFGVRNVTTSPALLESTSLVFAYGLDMFGTRVSPSFSFDILGKDFNKVSMLTTVAAIAALTFVVAPLVTRKQIDARWTLTS